MEQQPAAWAALNEPGSLALIAALLCGVASWGLAIALGLTVMRPARRRRGAVAAAADIPPRAAPPSDVSPSQAGVLFLERSQTPAAILLGLAVDGALRIELAGERAAVTAVDARRARAAADLEAMRRVLPDGSPGASSRLGPSVEESSARFAGQDDERAPLLIAGRPAGRLALVALGLALAAAGIVLSFLGGPASLSALAVGVAATAIPAVIALGVLGGLRPRSLSPRGERALREIEGVARLAALPTAELERRLAEEDARLGRARPSAAERLIPYALMADRGPDWPATAAIVRAAEASVPGAAATWIVDGDPRSPLADRVARFVRAARRSDSI